MSHPYFFVEQLPTTPVDMLLDEETSKHLIQVLRTQEGENIMLTDGKGKSAIAVIKKAAKKSATVQLKTFFDTAATGPRLSIGISLVKNTSRFEWFLEKATELGVSEIIPMICERTERQKVRHDRMLSICKSAMLQSMQTWLPTLQQVAGFNEVVQHAQQHQKMIAHCAEDAKVDFSSLYNPSLASHIILIGPEGDFTQREIFYSRERNFFPVSLGTARLRTETAGIFAAAWVSGARQ